MSTPLVLVKRWQEVLAMTRSSVIAVASLAFAACAPRSAPAPATLPVPGAAHSVIPLPSTVVLEPGQVFVLDSTVAIYVDSDAGAEVMDVARYAQSLLRPPVDSSVRSLPAGGTAPDRGIRLSLDASHTSLGGEAYELRVSSTSIAISARTPAGLFYGVQTLRQLLPVSVEHRFALRRRLSIPAGTIVDNPRFEWRGLMLDVTRHFLRPADVKHFIDLMALYKLNRLHLHLSDDQGWRIEVKSRPNLTLVGGATQVGGGPGGFYTQEEYSDIVAYAASRFITVVPEIDMPGHTNAALASYPELNCDGIARPAYTGIRVGFSALCVDSARIYPILEDIVREISALTPGSWFHIGGDEVLTMPHDKYLRFIERMQGMVNANGKQMIGWGEIAPAQLSPATIVQNWKRDSSDVHAARGGKIILSPATKIYLDQKYDSTTILGLNWAGFNSVRTSYDWDPAIFLPGVPAAAIIGVEAPLWAETTVRRQDYEYLIFPRLLAVAETGWTDSAAKSWPGFRQRVENHLLRLNALGVNTPREIRWESPPKN